VRFTRHVCFTGEAILAQLASNACWSVLDCSLLLLLLAAVLLLLVPRALPALQQLYQMPAVV
jgi:hypothetical protein